MSATRRQVLARTGALGAGIAFTGSLSELFAGTAAAQGTGAAPATARSSPTPTACSTCPRASATGSSPARATRCAPARARCPATTTAWPPSPGPPATGTARHPPGPQPREPHGRPRSPSPPSRASPTTRWARAAARPWSWTGTTTCCSERVAIAGTAVNCAGGPTPWDTWLTCEETEDKAGDERLHQGPRLHLRGRLRTTRAAPAPSRSPRWAASSTRRSPSTRSSGIVYETEDAFEKPFGLFYRFLPKKPHGRLRFAARGRPAPGDAGAGRARPVRHPGAGHDLRRHRVGGRTRPARQGDPHPLPGLRPGAASPTPRSWRAATGAARASTSSPASRTARRARRPTTSARSGATTRSGAGSPWSIVFGPDTDLQLPGESPDNICLAPSGGLMVCEDGEGAQHVFGLTRRGEVYAMARGAPEHRHAGGAGVGRVRGRHLLPRRPHDVRQLLHPGHDVRGHRPLAPLTQQRAGHWLTQRHWLTERGPGTAVTRRARAPVSRSRRTAVRALSARPRTHPRPLPRRGRGRGGGNGGRLGRAG